MNSPNEISFLKELQEAFTRYAEEARDVEDQMEHDVESATIRLRELLAKIKQTEMTLREKYRVDRFKVFPRELQQLIDKVDTAAPVVLGEGAEEEDSGAVGLQEGETYIYIYLFNSQGSQLSSWQKLVTAGALEEHAVSRPIYAKVEHVEEMLRTKPFIEQHAYLEVKIKKSDIADDLTLHDSLNHPVVRLKEGALKTGNIIRFRHKNKNYAIMFSGATTAFELLETQQD
ncbi:MAG: hypothetical protein GY782_04090 [Gammaproteobacteria bacterium]|nr:hypothetical protein [Gammaproteobacteria bacterium]